MLVTQVYISLYLLIFTITLILHFFIVYLLRIRPFFVYFICFYFKSFNYLHCLSQPHMTTQSDHILNACLRMHFFSVSTVLLSVLLATVTKRMLHQLLSSLTSRLSTQFTSLCQFQPVIQQFLLFMHLPTLDKFEEIVVSHTCLQETFLELVVSHTPALA